MRCKIGDGNGKSDMVSANVIRDRGKGKYDTYHAGHLQGEVVCLPSRNLERILLRVEAAHQLRRPPSRLVHQLNALNFVLPPGILDPSVLLHPHSENFLIRLTL